MAARVNRGEIWRYEFKRPDKLRPVLVLSRPEVIPLLATVMVAPVTSTIRGAPSEVIVGIEEGLKHDSAVNLDHLQTIDHRPATAEALCRKPRPTAHGAGRPRAGHRYRMHVAPRTRNTASGSHRSKTTCRAADLAKVRVLETARTKDLLSVRIRVSAKSEEGSA